MWAGQCGHTETAAKLVEYGADVNAATENGATALSRACRAGYAETAAWLQEHGAVGAEPLPAEHPSHAWFDFGGIVGRLFGGNGRRGRTRAADK